MAAEPCRAEVAHLADQLERAFRGGAWHGPAVLEALEDIDAASAAQRPVPEGHTIWEIVSHLTAWLDVARRRIEGEASRRLPDELDWPATETVSEEAWSQHQGAMDTAHRALQGTLEGLADTDLDRALEGAAPTVRGLLFGILQHNLYHAGQVALLKKLVAGPGDGP